MTKKTKKQSKTDVRWEVIQKMFDSITSHLYLLDNRTARVEGRVDSANERLSHIEDDMCNTQAQIQRSCKHRIVYSHRDSDEDICVDTRCINCGKTGYKFRFDLSRKKQKALEALGLLKKRTIMGRRR